MLDFAGLRDDYIRQRITPVEYILALAASSYMPPNVLVSSEYMAGGSYRLEGTMEMRDRCWYFQVTVKEVQEHCRHPDEGLFTVNHENQIYRIEALIQPTPIENTDVNVENESVENIPERIRRIGLMAGTVCL